MNDISQTAQYRNVVEILVEQEVERQLKKLPAAIKPYVSPVDVITYALNCFKPLYACSKKGADAQLAKARREYGDRITEAVQWGICAVQRDPLRISKPVDMGRITPDEKALDALRDLLNNPILTWEEFIQLLKRTLYVDHLAFQHYRSASPENRPEILGSTSVGSLTWQDYKLRRGGNVGEPKSGNPGEEKSVRNDRPNKALGSQTKNYRLFS